jgi:hypothetical protein
MRRLVLYPFRYRDELTGKWVKARYLAELHDIETRHAEWQIVGPPEVRELAPNARYFHPYRLVPHADLMRLSEAPPQLNPHLERPPAIDTVERFLVALFLRRYVTYCARRGRLAQMQGAARLRREVMASREQGMQST